MKQTSTLYNTILAHDHKVEWKIVINGTAFREDELFDATITKSVFGDGSPQVGSCVAKEIDIRLMKPESDFPAMAKIEVLARITDGENTSEWLNKGTFFIDTREFNKDDSFKILTLHGYDRMLMAEQNAPLGDEYPMTDIDVLEMIAEQMGCEIADDTAEKIDQAYELQAPTNYSSREVLGYIAAMYCGCFVMNDDDELQLITINGMPLETNYLITDAGQYITFGGTRIYVI